jgi:hypothetical protein
MSACCQALVGACGYILSCLALNSIAIQGLWLSGHLPGTWDTPERGYRGPGRMLSRIARRS